MENEDILQKLIDTEKSSRQLVSEAQAEIDRRMSETKRQADEGFRRACEEAVKALESDLGEIKRKADDEYRAELGIYAASLDARASNLKDFTLLLDRIREMES